jgi:26S proteasome non-ATPase regulatory subunit 9
MSGQGGLHAPTVPSGPTTIRATNGDTKNVSFAELQRNKENLEAELKALSSVLDSVC